MKNFFTALRDKLRKIKKKIYEFKLFQNRFIFLCIPLVVVLVALICGTIYQLSPKYDKFANIGVDFQGGTLLNVEMTSNNPNFAIDMNKSNFDYNTEIIKGVLSNYGFAASTVQASGESAIVIRYSNVAYGNDPTRESVDYGKDEKVFEMEEINKKISADIVNAFKTNERYADKDVIVTTSSSLIGNSSSINLLKSALIACSIAILAMFIYIIIRFNPFSAIATYIALMHDIIIMMAFTVIFRVEIGSTIVAAIITIIGYSINNTIVIFDRLRDIIKPYKVSKKNFSVPEIVNESVSKSLTRTIYATLTTLITISILAILGVSTIRTFALPIIFGLFAGFFSANTLSAPLWGMFTLSWEKRKLKKKKAASASYTKRK